MAIGLLSASLFTQHATAQRVAQADYDMAASGYVTPAGMPPVGYPNQGMGGPGQGYNGLGHPGARYPGPGVAPAGFSQPCDTGFCDGMPMQQAMDRMVCGTCGGGGGCGCNGLFKRGIFSKMKSGKICCLFCRGAGCSACKQTPFGYCAGMLANCYQCCLPYSGANICNQRWYDLSVEALVLDRNFGSSVPSVVTTQGIDGTPVLSLGDVGSDGVQGGVRVSGAMLWGPGGNIEGTYMGGNKWSGGASVNSSSPNLYSFISDYGTDPLDGFDDTDRSLQQSLYSESEFHSVELNYRRRTMFPYCRFQSSWLVGLRYIRYSDSLQYSARGDFTNTGNGNLLRFYNSQSESKNDLFGPQAGYDFWWNVCSGVSFGIGSKVAWMQNDVDRSSSFTANSAGIGATPGGLTVDDGDRRGTVMGDFELKMIYRLTHSFTFRSSYYLMGVNDVSFGGLDAATSRAILQGNTVSQPFAYEDLVLQGFTIGGEYMW